MPKRQQATALVGLGFHADNCVKFSGSSDNHKNMAVRIRKHDLPKIESNEAYGADQIYVRVPARESLAIDIGTFIKIKTNRRELSFEVSSIRVMTAITSLARFHRTAVLSGCFAKELAEE
jgi:hypothetical protein